MQYIGSWALVRYRVLELDSFRKILTQSLEGDDLPEYGIAAVLGDESCLRLEDESWLN